MSNFKVAFVVSILLILTNVTFSQEDTTTISIADKLFFEPTFHGIQADAIIGIFMYEFGGQIDFDLLRTQNLVCIGIRLSFEDFVLQDLGGSVIGSPFKNYNLFARLSNSDGYFFASVLGGLTYYKTNHPIYIPNEYMVRIGFEIKYGKVVSLILNGSTSFKEKTSFIGVGVSLDYNHLL